MKIALIVNTFNTSLDRFKIANESYRSLDQYKGIDVFDIQKPGVKGKFKTLDKLERTSKDVIKGSTKELPFVNDLFNIAADLDGYEYFIVTNADVVISTNLIKHIVEKKITALPCSRLDVTPTAKKRHTRKLPNYLSTMRPVRWEVCGFDTFCFKTDWYKAHSNLFEDFLLGKPAYDEHYATIMKIFGNNDSIGNKNPALCIHEHHGIGAVTTKDVEQEFNFKQYDNSNLAQNYKHIWQKYVHKIPLQRQPQGSFLHEIEGEENIELNFWAEQIKQHGNLINEDKRKYNII